MFSIGGWSARPVIKIETTSKVQSDFEPPNVQLALGLRAMPSPNPLQQQLEGIVSCNIVYLENFYFGKLNITCSHQFQKRCFLNKTALRTGIGIGDEAGQNTFNLIFVSKIYNLCWNHNIFLNG